MSADQAPIEPDRVRQALERILRSPEFVQSARQRRFLHYVVNQALAGNPQNLKGYPIGIDVFDRPADFDPAVDSIVRVEATRLRSKLREYYATAGRTETLKIDLPKGGYAPVFSIVDGISDEERAADDRPGAARTRSSAQRPSIIVLPFTNLSGDQEQEYFVDGITEDLIGGLSKLSGMHVIARQSAFYYKDKQATARQIGREVDVRYLLEGSVRKAGDRIRISTELVVAETEEPIWQERYDRDLEDIFALQDDVVKNIIDSLEVELSERDRSRLQIATAANVEAHDLVSRGREYFWSYTPDGAKEAQASFRRAIEIDPDYAFAHAWMARVIVFPIAFNWSKDTSVLDDALEHVRTSLRLEPNLPFAHGIASWTHLWRKEIDDALVEGQLGVDLDVNDFDAHMFYSLALCAANKGDAALVQVHRAERLNPHPPANCILALGLAYMVSDDADAAIAAFQRGIVRNPNFVPFYVFLARMYAQTGEREAAVSMVRELSRRSSESMNDPDAWNLLVEDNVAAADRKFRKLALKWYDEARVNE